MNGALKHADLTGKILGCAFEVHGFLGNGFKEVVYQRALALELTKLRVQFRREVPSQIFYKEYKIPIGLQRVDFLVEDCVLVELKAVPELNVAHHAQLLNYLRIFNAEVGLLINFGSKSMTFKRLIHSNK